MAGSRAIRELLKSRNMTQQQLADLLGVDVSQIKTALYRDLFSVKMLLNICDVLGVHLAIIDGENTIKI